MSTTDSPARDDEIDAGIDEAPVEAAPEGQDIPVDDASGSLEGAEAPAGDDIAAAIDEDLPPVQDTRTDVKWVTVLIMTLVLSLSVWPYKILMFWPGYDIWAKGKSDTWLQGSENLTAMAGSMLNSPGAPFNYVVAFEILAVLLVAALVGAIVLAMRDGGDRRD